jgi:succinyl-diaminopimelate desuccinylase
MPQSGVNAVYKAARVALALEKFDFSMDEHPVLGRPTLNVGWMQGGMNVNSVPDKARLGIDLRLVPDVDREKLLDRLKQATGGEAAFRVLGTHDPLWTDISDPWVMAVAAAAAGVTGNGGAIGGASYFTDGVALKPAMGHPPTVIVGPGEPELAHQTDEYCAIDRIEQSEAIYDELMRRWCGI